MDSTIGHVYNEYGTVLRKVQCGCCGEVWTEVPSNQWRDSHCRKVIVQEWDGTYSYVWIKRYLPEGQDVVLVYTDGTRHTVKYSYFIDVVL